ncbi:hypothetical protein NRA51_12585 [Acinetobacter baumannii]|nr:hypothetical protein [Acinetobacter baumannii]
MLDTNLIESVSELEKFKEFEVKFFGEERFPTQIQSGKWREEGLKSIKEIITTLTEYSVYYTPQFSEEVKIKLNEVIILYKKIIEVILIEDISNFSLYFNNIKSNISTIVETLLKPKFKDITQDEFKNDDFFKLTPYIIALHKLDSLGQLLTFISKESNKDLYYKTTCILVDFNNLSYREKSEKISVLPAQITSIYQNYVEESSAQKKEELRMELSKVEQKRLQTIEEIERAKNSLIITAFKDKSDSVKDYINILYFMISLLFLVIIASLFFRLNIKPEEKFHLLPFLYFVSYITAISSFLAFLIKEKNRLVAQSDYFNRCHVELSALPTYVYDLEKSEIENLKIELAHKYFTGGATNNENKNNNQDLNISNENIKQMLEIIKEVSKK